MNSPNNENNFFKEEISLKDLFQEIRRRILFLFPYRYFIIISVFFGITSGFIYFKKQKIKYKAEINFVMEEGQGAIASGGGLASQLGLNLGGSKSNIFSGETFFAFMKSRFLVEKVLLSPIVINGEEISYIEYYTRTFNLRKSLSNDSFLKNFVFKPNLDKKKLTINQVRFLSSIYSKIVTENLDVRPKDTKTSFLTIEFISENEMFSKNICEKIAEVASEFYIETINKKAKLNLDILQKQTDSIRQELYFAMSGAASATDQIFNLNPSVLVNKIPSTKRQIEVQANTAILTQLVTNLESAKVSLRKETPLIQIIDTPILPLEEVVENKYKYILIGALCSFSISILISIMILKLKH
jgi:hypothetical protein